VSWGRDANDAISRRAAEKKVDVRGAMTWLVVCAVCVGVTGFARPAAAQDVPKVEVSGGWNYQAMKSNDDEDWTHFSKGWYADVAVAVTNMWSAVGQVAGDYKTITDLGAGGSIDASLHSYLFGVRASGRGNAKATPYAQILFGATRFHLSGTGFDAKENMFTYQVGGGVNVKVNDSVGARVSADYVRAMPGDNSDIADEAFQGIRLGVGLVFGFGK
jgi:opacity protein-like surface antigen